ncbi:MAG: YdeI/OmpD-associated family protein [Candidatus Baltobacteraceae bacterium]
MKHKFLAKLLGYERPGGACYISVPKKVMQEFTPSRRVPIKGTINGVDFKTTIADMGDGPCFVVNAKMREEAQVKRGDTANIVIERDTQKRTVAIPKDLLAAMSVAESQRFKKFSYTHQKEYVEAIEAAKRPETRTRRIQKTIEMIQEKM